MPPLLESFLIWTLHPFFINFCISKKQEEDNLKIDYNENGEAVQKVDKEAKPFSWSGFILESMFVSAFGTGFWVLLHWLILWMADQTFDWHHFIKGRGSWIDLIPYVLSIATLLSFVVQKSTEVGVRLKSLFTLLRLAFFLLSFYILIFNYLYWVKH